MASPAAAPQRIPARPPLNTLSRFEHVADISIPLTSSVPTNQVNQPPGNQLPNDRFAYQWNIQGEARIVNANTNNPTGVAADAPFSMADTITMGSLSRARNTQEFFILARGADLRQLAALQQARTPLVSPAALATGPGATNDVRFIIPIFMPPMGVPLHQQFDFLWDMPNYDTPKLLIQTADDQNLFTYGTRSAPTYSANGSGTGNPRFRISARFAHGGLVKFKGFVPARKWIEFFEDTSSIATTTATAVRLGSNKMPVGNRIRGVLTKAGVKLTTVAGGNNSYNTLSDSILANVKWNRGLNRIVRFYADVFQMREDSAQSWSYTLPAGYQWVDWCPSGTWHEALDLTSAVAGTTGDIDTVPIADVTGASNQGILTLYEELRGLPLYPSFTPQELPAGWRFIQPGPFMRMR